MAKLLHLSRPSRRVSNVMRTWFALRRQKQRRQRGAAGVVLPQVTLAFVELQLADQGSWTPVLDVGIQGELPEGVVVKVWRALDETGEFTYRGSQTTSGLFADGYGMPIPHTTTYRARAANADDSVVGPWSEEVFIDSP